LLEVDLRAVTPCSNSANSSLSIWRKAWNIE